MGIDLKLRFPSNKQLIHWELMHLSVNFGTTVWKSFRSWLRTMKKDLPPSEMVVSYALRSSLSEFLLGRNKTLPMKKFIMDNADPHIMPDWRLGS